VLLLSEYLRWFPGTVFQAPAYAYNAAEKLPKSGLLVQSPTVLVDANDNDRFHVALRLFAKDDKGPLDLKDFSFKWKKDGGSVAWYQ
jgi:hypothetical protein